jgi:hypothetical protein
VECLKNDVLNKMVCSGMFENWRPK